MWFFYYFHFERSYEVLKSKSPCILLNKNINFNNNETKSKMENVNTVLERRTLCSSSYDNRKLKVKLWWVGVRKRKKRAFFVPFILCDRNFLKICVLSQCAVHRIHFQNIHPFTNQKALLHILFFLTHYLHKKKKFNLKTYNSTLLDIYGISVGEKLKNKL